MKTYLVDSDAGLDAVKYLDVPEPLPKADEVKMKVRAASLNYRDLAIVSGGYPRNDTRPVVPVSDAAGEVVEVGAAVDRWKVGDRVSPIFVRDWIDGPPTDAALRTCLGGSVDGVLAEYVTMPQQSLVAVPDEYSFAEAATIPCAAVTAWHALFESGRLQPGQTVLLLGTGGVSIFALQLAKAAGATVIITSSSDQKLERARALGADHGINYRTHPEWHTQVKAITDGEGVDHVVEVGGPGTLERSIKSTKVGGHVHLIGILDSPKAAVQPLMAMFNLLTVRGIYVGSRTMHQDTLDFMVRHRIQPIIDQTFAFSNAMDAYREFAKQNHFGKVVIEMD
jgi:NADPH:quinone reductase-like Zn-dependent oxidoreductase